MLRNFSFAVATALLACGCSNGWPHVHHLAQPQTAGATCTPIASRIARQGCTTNQPASSTTQSEFDRQGLGPGGAPLQAPGNLNSPR